MKDKTWMRYANHSRFKTIIVLCAKAVQDVYMDIGSFINCEQ